MAYQAITGINVNAPLPNPIPRADKIKYKANYCTRSPAAPDNPAARWYRACMYVLSRDPTGMHLCEPISATRNSCAYCFGWGKPCVLIDSRADHFANLAILHPRDTESQRVLKQHERHGGWDDNYDNGDDDEGDEGVGDCFPVNSSVTVLRYTKPRPTNKRNPTRKNNAGTVAAAESKQPLHIPQESAGGPTLVGNDGADDSEGSDISHVNHGSHGNDSHDSDGDDLESRVKKESNSSSHSPNALLLRKENDFTRIIIDLTEELSSSEANDFRHRSSSSSSSMTDTSTRSHHPKGFGLSSIEAGSRVSQQAKDSSVPDPQTSPWSGAIYRFLTYDSSISQVTPFESNSFFGMDECSQLDEVLSRLENPGKFAPYFESMVRDGYDIVTGGGNIIVFKKRPTDERSPGETGGTRCKHSSKELSIVLAGLMGEVPLFEEKFFSLSEEDF